MFKAFLCVSHIAIGLSIFKEGDIVGLGGRNFEVHSIVFANESENFQLLNIEETATHESALLANIESDDVDVRKQSLDNYKSFEGIRGFSDIANSWEHSNGIQIQLKKIGKKSSDFDFLSDDEIIGAIFDFSYALNELYSRGYRLGSAGEFLVTRNDAEVQGFFGDLFSIKKSAVSISAPKAGGCCQKKNNVRTCCPGAPEEEKSEIKTILPNLISSWCSKAQLMSGNDSICTSESFLAVKKQIQCPCKKSSPSDIAGFISQNVTSSYIDTRRVQWNQDEEKRKSQTVEKEIQPQATEGETADKKSDSMKFAVGCGIGSIFLISGLYVYLSKKAKANLVSDSQASFI